VDRVRTMHEVGRWRCTPHRPRLVSAHEDGVIDCSPFPRAVTVQDVWCPPTMMGTRNMGRHQPPTLTNIAVNVNLRHYNEVGGHGSIGHQYAWKRAEADKNILRTHTTAVSARCLHKAGLNDCAHDVMTSYHHVISGVSNQPF
jgi:hypothetical protein